MYSKEEFVQAIKIAFRVSWYLLKTNRVQNAIELCKENLFLVNHKLLESEKDFVIRSKMMVHIQMFLGYKHTKEHSNAIDIGRKIIAASRNTGQRDLEGDVTILLAQLYRHQCDYNEATELYTKALSIATQTGNKEMEGLCYINLGNIFQCLGVCAKAAEYHEKALAIAQENDDRETEVACYGNLVRMFASFGEYVKAKEYQEKALVVVEKNGNWKEEAACYGNLGTISVSLCEYAKAKEYQEKRLAIAEKVGDRKTKAECYLDLGIIFQSLSKYFRANEYYEKALAIATKISDRETEAACYANLGSSFVSVGEYVKAKEYQEKSLAIAKTIGDKKLEATCYANLGTIFESVGEYVRAKEYQEKTLEIAEKIGDWKAKATCFLSLGSIFQTLGEYVKAKEYQEKALVIAKKIGDKQTEAACYRNLETNSYSLCEYVKAKEYYEKTVAIAEKIASKGAEAACRERQGRRFLSLGEFVKAKDCLERALALHRETGETEREPLLHLLISVCLMNAGNMPEAKSHFFACISKGEVIRRFLKDHEQFKISYFDKIGFLYRIISLALCSRGNLRESLYAKEIGRARALADLMSSQYSIENEISVHTQAQAPVGIEKIMKTQNNCACLYISYFVKCINLFVIKADKELFLRSTIVQCCSAGSESSLSDIFYTEKFREVHCLAPGQCEDRSWLPSNVRSEQTRKSSQGNSLTGCRPVEEDENEQQPILTLADGYRMIIAPVADFLDKPEIIIVPDRLFFRVPFAALKDERGKYLSESFRIRIVPSLATLKLIQDSPADYHSQTGALIVGDPEVGEVLYKGNLQHVSRLPFASEEAEMVGDLLDITPLLGKKATKKTILQSIHSVSLIHFAAHGDAERGEIVLAPPPLIDRKPQEEDYLLTMADISQIRLRAKLVVLSCCHSAQGQIKTEGVVGIARAFLGSGARSVLVALWAIQDEATKQFMGRFYEHLVRGESASESLHQAMKWMRENGFSDMEQWAPFMLVGDNVTLDFQKLR